MQKSMEEKLYVLQPADIIIQMSLMTLFGQKPCMTL